MTQPEPEHRNIAPTSPSEATRKRPSLARNSLAVLLSDGGTLLFGFISGVITARVLGPYDKGTLSALLFLGDVFFLYVCGLGLGEATTIMLGKKQTTLQEALSASLFPLLLASLGGIGGLLLISFPAGWQGILPAVLIEGAAFAALVGLHFLMTMLNTREQFVTTSFVWTARVATMGIGIIVFVVVLDLGIAGGTLANLVGAVPALIFAVFALRKLGLSLRPRWSGSFLRKAVSYGLWIQGAYLLIAMSQRFDQLIVYQVRGQFAGGQYAVALSLGQLVVYAPFAMAAASFPRIAQVESSEVRPLAQRVSRSGLAASILTGTVLVVAIPLLIRFFYGPAYSSATAPAVVLVLGGIIWSQQWLLARASAARGKTSLLVRSFAANVVTMAALDYLLIPRFGLMGAAWASVIGSTVGLLFSVHAYRHSPELGGSLRELVPRREDFTELIRYVMEQPAKLVRRG